MRREEDNIELDFKETGWDGTAEDKIQWRALVNTVMKFRFT